MKNLIACLLFLVGVTAHAANPSMAQLNFASNSLVAQISAAGVWTNDSGTYRLIGQSNTISFYTVAVTAPFLEIVGGYPNVDSVLSLRGDIIRINNNQSHVEMGVDYDHPWIYLFQTSPFTEVTVMDGLQEFGDRPYLFNTGTNVLAPGGIHTAFANAGTNVLGIFSDKTTNATPFDAGALFSAYNGVATLLHATATNSLITVGGSPFNYTNTAAQTIVLYLDANGATTAVKLNGTQIFASLAAGDHTIILKPGAYTTVTYAIATPVMTWTEL